MMAKDELSMAAVYVILHPENSLFQCKMNLCERCILLQNETDKRLNLVCDKGFLYFVPEHKLRMPFKALVYWYKLLPDLFKISSDSFQSIDALNITIL
jgi:hypothetical protein